MNSVRVACAAGDKPAGDEVVRALRALGYAAALAPLSASRAAAQDAPAVLVWSRRAAAEPKLRALLRQSKAPLVARVDHAPAPPQCGAAIINWAQPGAAARLAALLNPPGGLDQPQPAAAPASSTRAIAAAPPSELEAEAPAKKRGVLGWLLFAALLAAAGAAGAYLFGVI
jgi:hypothetical protein